MPEVSIFADSAMMGVLYIESAKNTRSYYNMEPTVHWAIYGSDTTKALIQVEI